MKFTLALAQIDSVLGDVKKNVIRHVEFIRRAKEGGADLIVFPELSLSGYSLKDLNWDVVINRSRTEWLKPILDESAGISIIAGGVEESVEYGIYNSAFFFEQGEMQVVHRKLYPPTYGMFEELRYFSPGKHLAAFQSKVGTLGVLICEDLWHLPLPYLLAQDGASVIIGIVASPTRISPQETELEIGKENLENHRSYARLLSAYVAFCNRVGYEDGVNFWGGSEVVGPSGDLIVRAPMFDEGIVFAEIDDAGIRRARQFSRHFLDDDIHLVQDELKRISKNWRANTGSILL